MTTVLRKQNPNSPLLWLAQFDEVEFFPARRKTKNKKTKKRRSVSLGKETNSIDCIYPTPGGFTANPRNGPAEQYRPACWYSKRHHSLSSSLNILPLSSSPPPPPIPRKNLFIDWKDLDLRVRSRIVLCVSCAHGGREGGRERGRGGGEKSSQVSDHHLSFRAPSGEPTLSFVFIHMTK